MNKIKFLLLFSISLVAFTATAQEINIYPNGYIKGAENSVPRDSIAIVGGDEVHLLNDVRQPTITIFKAKGKSKNKTVVVSPGGGYYILSAVNEGSKVCELLNKNGYDAVLLKYRVPAPKGDNRHVMAYQDLQRAISLVRENGDEYGICSDQVGVIGFSAGGLISALVCNGERSYEPIDAADEFSCKADFCALIYPGGMTSGANKFELRDILTVDSTTPKTFLVAAEDDGCAYAVLYYYHALKEAKVPSTLHIYSDGGHGFGMRNTGAVNDWSARYIDWMNSL